MKSPVSGTAAPRLSPNHPPALCRSHLCGEIRTKAKTVLDKFFSDAAEWCKGKWWITRLPILIYLLYAGIRHLYDPQYSGWFGGITFGIHELGHFVFAFGDFLRVAGGTIAQIGAPLAGAYMLGRQRDYFGVAVCLAWLAFSLFGAATYMADARARELTLAAPGVGVVDGGDGSVGHDWTYLFTAMSLLQYDTLIAGITRILAGAIWLGSMVFSSWLLITMARPSRLPDQPGGQPAMSEAEKIRAQFEALSKDTSTSDP